MKIAGEGLFLSFPGFAMYKFILLFLLFHYHLLSSCAGSLFAATDNMGIASKQTKNHIDSLLTAADNIDHGPAIMLSLSERAHQLSEFNGYTYGMLHSTYNIARAYFYQSKLQKSYQILDSLLTCMESDSIAVSKVINYRVTRSKIYTLMAVIFQDLNDYKTSMQYYLRALELIDKPALIMISD